jgi:hypothetical protein
MLSVSTHYTVPAIPSVPCHLHWQRLIIRQMHCCRNLCHNQRHLSQRGSDCVQSQTWMMAEADALEWNVRPRWLREDLGDNVRPPDFHDVETLLRLPRLHFGARPPCHILAEWRILLLLHDVVGRSDGCGPGSCSTEKLHQGTIHERSKY